MSLIPEQSIEAMRGEVTDLRLMAQALTLPAIARGSRLAAATRLGVVSPTFPTGPQNLRFSDCFAVKAESLQRAEIGKPL
jgi:hypothetical protein